MEDTLQTQKSFWEKVKTTFSNENMSKTAKIVKGVASVIAVVGGVLTSPICPIVFTTTALWWIGSITLVSGTIAGVAQTDTSKNGSKGIVTTISNIIKKVTK